MTGHETHADIAGLTPIHDTSRKQKNVLTASLLMSFFGLGLVRGQEGVVFLDLLLIIRKDLETGSLLFLFSSPGYMAGALGGGLLYDRLDALTVYTCCVACTGLVSFTTPFCQSFVLMGVTLFARNVFAGAMSTGGNVICVSMWRGESSLCIQALHFVFATGALTVSFIAEPFLAPKLDNLYNNNTAEGLYSPDGNRSWGNSTQGFPQAEQSTQVYVTFLIVGAFLLVSSVPFVAQLCQRRKHSGSTGSRSAQPKEADMPSRRLRTEERGKLIWHRVLMYVLIGLLYTMYGCIEKGCGTFFMPFVVEYVRWDKATGARLLACFWGSFTGSRLLRIAIAKVVNEFNMLLVDFLVLTAGFCLLLFASKGAAVVWTASVVVGHAQSGIYPTVAAWINQRISRVTGVVSALFCVSVSVASMFHLPLLGYLFQERSPAWFTYLSIGSTALCFLSFIGLHWLGKSIHGKRSVTNMPIDSMELNIDKHTQVSSSGLTTTE